MDRRQYREYLRDCQQMLHAKEHQLQQLIERLKQTKIPLPQNLPDLTAYHIPPITVEKYEAPSDDAKLPSDPESVIKTMKEPVFDESELSDIGQLMVEAHNKGIPFKIPKINSPPRAERRRLPLPTPSPDPIKVKTVVQFFKSPSGLYSHNRHLLDSQTNSPDLPKNDLNKGSAEKETTINESPQLSSYTMELMKEKFYMAPQASTSTKLVATPIKSVLKSPDEPELEHFQKVNISKPLASILKSPESPELSKRY